MNEISRDRAAPSLRELCEEVSRIAASLARLSVQYAAPPQKSAPLPATNVSEVSAETVNSLIRARRQRCRYFPEELFADPAWDMMLDLLAAEISQRRVSISSLCVAAAVPATTALRWINTLEQQGLFVRRPDFQDARREFVELSPPASDLLRRYFADLSPVCTS